MSEPVRLCRTTDVRRGFGTGLDYPTSDWNEDEELARKLLEGMPRATFHVGTWFPDDGNEAARDAAGALLGVAEGYRRFLEHEAADHPLRDELLAQVDGVLAKARGEAPE